MTSNFSVERIESNFSSTYHCWLYHAASEISGRLYSVLERNLPHIAAVEIPERVRWGGVFVNGLEVNDNLELPVPCKLEYYEPRFPIAEAERYFPRFSEDLILYEDQYLLALFKPAKLPTNPGKEQKYFNVRSYVEKYIHSMPHLPSRLDMSTCGVIIMSKAQETHKPLQRLFEYGAVKKTYILGTHGEVDWESYDHQGSIGRDPRHAVLRKVVEVGGKPARTFFTRLQKFDQTTFVKAEPLTGRTHQIRVHASDLGYPIIGDNFYGGAASLHLHLMAHSVSFRHPKGGAPLTIAVPDRLYPEWLPKQLQIA